MGIGYVEFANIINGRELGEELTVDEENTAKKNGIVVVYGASDDLCEIRGAIDAEVDCYGGGEIHLHNRGVFQDCNNGCVYSRKAKEMCKKITALWCDEDSAYVWSYRTNIPHAKFSVKWDDEFYCEGICFDVKSLPIIT